MRRAFVLFCLIVGVIFCAVRVFNNSKSVQQTVIQFSSWGSESELKILKPILAEFERENPDIKVDFIHIPQNYFQKIHLLFASNTAPDVIFMNNQYLPIYVNAGVLEDLSQYDFEYEKFYDKALAALGNNGKFYAIPRDVSTLVVYYNKDIFNRYNVEYPKNGWSLDEFKDIAVKLTHLPEIFGVSFDDEPLFYFPYLTSFGAKDFSDFTDKGLQEGVRFYADLRNKYHCAPKKEEAASMTMAQMFLQGRLGMQVSGRWLVPKYRQEAKFDWDVVEFPVGIVGKNVPLDASGWVISKSSKHKPEAAKLIKFLSSKESMEKFTQSGLIVPARVDVANSRYFLDGQKPKHSQVFLSTIETSVPTPVSIDFRQVLDNLKNKTEVLFNR
ncbi:MAG: sugar ABC transporter substrate-binding protein [Muribaculaceae bacterium]|nr:sugar ABC transporter substrate-binding protein [Muribaculaceae bacterium]